MRLLTRCLSLVCLATLASACVVPTPEGTRLSWTGPTDTTLTVTWNEAVGPARAEIRQDGGAPVSVDARELDTDVLGLTLEATFTGLSPDTAYEVRTCDASACGSWSPTRTAPPLGSREPVRLVVLGDTRGEFPIAGYSPSEQWLAIRDHVIAEKPLAVLHTGDFLWDGGAPDQWATELDELVPLSSTIPFFMALGNHDVDDDGYFEKSFAFPATNPDATEDYYALVLGNVQVIVLSTETYDMDDQLDWLDEVLGEHPAEVDWRFVVFHRPVWSSGSHGSDDGGRTRASELLPVLEAHHVDVVFNGHDHGYERFHPSTGGYGAPRTVTPLAQDDGTRGEAEGVMYVVTGGGGASIDDEAPKHLERGSARVANRFNYVVVDVQGDEAVLTVRDLGSSEDEKVDAKGGDLEVVTLTKHPEAAALP